MDEKRVFLSEVLGLAEACDAALRRAAARSTVVSQPTEFPVPRQITPEEEALRVRLQRLSREQEAAVQAAFWLGRDHTEPDDFPGLLEFSTRNLDHVDLYLMSTTALTPSLRRAIGILKGR